MTAQMADLEDPDLSIPLLIPQPFDRSQPGLPLLCFVFVRSRLVQSWVQILEVVWVERVALGIDGDVMLFELMHKSLVERKRPSGVFSFACQSLHHDPRARLTFSNKGAAM